jgi:hypothetical protein
MSIVPSITMRHASPSAVGTLERPRPQLRRKKRQQQARRRRETLDAEYAELTFGWIFG